MRTLLKVSPSLCRPCVRTTLAGLLVSTFALLSHPAPALAAAESAPAIPASVAATITPPDAATVLYFIYDIDGKGKTSYEVQNGSIATYWFGHAFESEGKHYYTGFAWQTAARYGKEGEDQVGPGTQVNITESTFVLNDPTSERPWKFRGMEHSIGEFGAYETGEEVDTRRKPLEHRTPAGKLLLAVPTSSFGNGITSDGYALLVFNPERLKEDTDGNVWTYVGSVLTGEDNSAACADGDVMPCTNSEGELTFTADGSNDMPRLTVKPTGTTISGPNKTRQLGAADITHYSYDAAKKQYISR
ncbi:hypothetical protein [Achromobacter pestifer]|uniref:Uncharacterized protein n=1 Tax=Achromobacter pestifer TaxID=1353889 RepID=A0A6S6YQH7_9BURK|nr:hypothetical protein [Achromobacter pestifer]CAB3629454.1 hypothetical protein LMG3431_00881 [Achromobacter pestifer]